MMLTYTLQDAQAWADFSGDHNPIHFDLAHVRQMGRTQLSVHGMRAMLDMKQQLSAALLASSAPLAAAYRFSTRLRRPVLCDIAYRLAVSARAGQWRGSLDDGQTQETCFSSQLVPAALPALATRSTARRLSAADLAACAPLYPGEVADRAQTWGFLDALLFRQLVHATDTLTAVATVLHGLPATTLMAVFAQVPVVQTHHETHFSGTLLTPAGAACLDGPLYYTLLPTLVMGDHTEGVVLRAEVAMCTATEALMSSAVTLKTWPWANPNIERT